MVGRLFRLADGMTQEDLAELSDIPQTTLSGWKRKLDEGKVPRAAGPNAARLKRAIEKLEREEPLRQEQEERRIVARWMRRIAEDVSEGRINPPPTSGATREELEEGAPDPEKKDDRDTG